MGTAPGTDRDKDTRTPVVAARVRTVAQVHTAVQVRTAVRTVQGAQLEARHSG
jgi:hypothetical protein